MELTTEQSMSAVPVAQQGVASVASKHQDGDQFAEDLGDQFTETAASAAFDPDVLDLDAGSPGVDVVDPDTGVDLDGLVFEGGGCGPSCV